MYISGDISLCQFLYKWLLLWIKYSLHLVYVLCLKCVMWTWHDSQQVQVYSDLKYTLWDVRFWKHWQFAWLSYGLWHCVVWWVVTNIRHSGHNIQTAQCHHLEDDKMNFYIHKFSRLVLLQFFDRGGPDNCLLQGRCIVDCSSVIKVLTFWNLKFL
jgi:hypothetical protein